MNSSDSMGIPFLQIVDQEENTTVTEQVPNFVLNSTSYIKQKPLVLKLDKTCYACLCSISMISSDTARKNIYEVSFADILRKTDPFPIANQAKRMREEKLMAFNYDNDPHFYDRHFDTVHFNSDDAKPAYDDVDQNLLDEGTKVQIVPPVFARMYKGLTYHLYSQLVKDPTFLRTRIPCCVNCYLLYVGPDDPKQFEVGEILPTRVLLNSGNWTNPIKDHQSHKMQLKYLNTKYFVSKTVNKRLEEEELAIKEKNERRAVSHQGSRAIAKVASTSSKILLVRRSPSHQLRSQSSGPLKPHKRERSEGSTKIGIAGKVPVDKDENDILKAIDTASAFNQHHTLERRGSEKKEHSFNKQRTFSSNNSHRLGSDLVRTSVSDAKLLKTTHRLEQKHAPFVVGSLLISMITAWSSSISCRKCSRNK